MPRASASAEDVVPFTVPAEPMPPPAELNEIEAGYWHALVDAFPPERFGADDRVLLIELCRHQSISRRVNGELDGLRGDDLVGPGRSTARTRTTFMQLAKVARDEAKLIATLSVKLRLARQTSERLINHQRERERMATGRAPWDVQ
jgi:hypothetical protein